MSVHTFNWFFKMVYQIKFIKHFSYVIFVSFTYYDDTFTNTDVVVTNKVHL